MSLPINNVNLLKINILADAIRKACEDVVIGEKSHDHKRNNFN